MGARMMRGLPLFFFLALAGGCARGANMVTTAKNAVATIEKSANVSREIFVDLDEMNQSNIVAKAQTLEAGQARLEAYRTLRTPVFRAFAILYAAIAAAKASVIAYETRGGSPSEIIKHVTECADLVLSVRREIGILTAVRPAP